MRNLRVAVTQEYRGIINKWENILSHKGEVKIVTLEIIGVLL